SFRDIAKRTANPKISHTTVGKIIKCVELPTLKTLLAVVRALGGDEARGRVLWRTTHDHLKAASTATVSLDDTSASTQAPPDRGSAYGSSAEEPHRLGESHLKSGDYENARREFELAIAAFRADEGRLLSFLGRYTEAGGLLTEAAEMQRANGLDVGDPE